jgi:hypothetical protein
MEQVRLNQDQKRTIALRAQYARSGVNYDKATRRLVERDLHTRPTLRAIPLKELILQTVPLTLFT